MERMMNKVSLVTLWVEPTSHQIVKYTFDNVNFDFLPAAWLAPPERPEGDDDDEPAVQGQTAGGRRRREGGGGGDLWMPKDVEFYFAAMLAIGSFDVRYRLDYHDYREAATSGRIKK